MTILTSNDKTYTFTTEAVLIDDKKDTASAWASKYIRHNPALKWIVGNYVEADNANSNGQYWTLDDLILKGATVDHAPMNMGHEAHSIVGTYVASEMIYPTQANVHPYIETVSAMWRYYFPEAYAKIEEAYQEGTLFQSMECIADSITCVGTEQACGATFAYQGPYGNYCEHINEGTAYRQLDNPHFVGGGLIIPPLAPGWKNAEINEVSELVNDNEGEKVYAEVATEAPHLQPAQWESLMQMIVLNETTLSSNTEDAKKAGRLLGIAKAAILNS